MRFRFLDIDVVTLNICNGVLSHIDVIIINF